MHRQHTLILWLVFLCLPFSYSYAKNHLYTKNPSHLYVLQSGHLVLTGNKVYQQTETFFALTPDFVDAQIQKKLATFEPFSDPTERDDTRQMLEDIYSEVIAGVKRVNVEENQNYLPYCVFSMDAIHEDVLSALNLANIDLFQSLDDHPETVIDQRMDVIDQNVSMIAQDQIVTRQADMAEHLKDFLRLLLEVYYFDGKDITELQMSLADFMADHYLDPDGDWIKQPGPEIQYEGVCDEIFDLNYFDQDLQQLNTYYEGKYVPLDRKRRREKFIKKVSDRIDARLKRLDQEDKDALFLQTGQSEPIDIDDICHKINQLQATMDDMLEDWPNSRVEGVFESKSDIKQRYKTLINHLKKQLPDGQDCK
ncbi:MAG: hypothetical protein R3A45_08395 [Bdellovibrionota bacterium]